MILLASFNGGPTESAVIFGVAGAGLASFLAGSLVRRSGLGAVIGALVAAVVCAIALVVGNKPGDMAGLALFGGLVLLGPLCAALGGVMGALAGWLFGRRPIVDAANGTTAENAEQKT